MKNTALIDAGPLIALFDKDDAYHEKAVQRINIFRQGQGRIVTTWPVITEAIYILQREIGNKAETALLKWLILKGGLKIYPLGHEHVERIVLLKEKYRNIPMDLADSSLVVIAEDLKTNYIFSIDTDFTIYRMFKNQVFVNLMEND